MDDAVYISFAFELICTSVNGCHYCFMMFGLHRNHVNARIDYLNDMDKICVSVPCNQKSRSWIFHIERY